MSHVRKIVTHAPHLAPKPEPQAEPVAAVSASAPKPSGIRLGDAVALVAQPIAKAIDAAAAVLGKKTHVAGCGGCKARQEYLNSLTQNKTGSNVL